MTSTSLEKPGDPCASQPLLVHFARNEDGVITLFSIVMMLLMLMVAGIGVDLMQNEMRRTTLQNTIDRAVLAAADLDQTRPATDVVEDYFNKTGLSEFLVAVNPDVSIGSRNVTAEAFMRSDTQFMSLLGVDTLPVPAYSQAIEDVPNVEISLVLDYSQSMASNSRIENLHFAAKAFIDIVLAGSAQQATSINLVPYAGQVNPGPWMFNRLGGTRYSATALDQADGGIPEIYSHVQLADGETGGVGSDPTLRYVYPNTSSCLEFADGAFARDDLPVRPYEQTPYFDGWSNPNNPLYYSLSDEEAAAGQSAERVTNEYGVGVNEIGFGWCPEDITDILYASNNATELKRRIEGSPMYDGTGTPYGMKWGLALLNPAVQYLFNEMSGASVGLVSPEFANRPSAFDDTETVKYIVLMTDGNITQQFRPPDYNAPENTTTSVRSHNWGSRDILTTYAENITFFEAQCDLAKHADRNIVIYTIAFEAPTQAQNQMKDCASSDSHFFNASGPDQIAAAFSTIARQINELRLTQ